MQSQRPPVVAAPANVVSFSDRKCLRVDRSRGTIKEAWEKYLASEALERLKPASRPVYRQAALEAIAGLSERPSRGEVQLWLEQQIAGGRSPATVNKLLRAMKAIMERAILLPATGNVDVHTRNAFRAIRPFKLPAKEKRAASLSTVQRLLQLAEDIAQRLAVRLGAFYGLRKGEIVGLQPSDVRTDNGILRVHVERERGDHGVGPRKNACNGKPHIVRIEDDPETAEMLLTLCELETRLSVARRGQKELAETWLLPWGHLYPDSLMAKWRKDPGVQLPPGDAWHALRHFGATTYAAQPGTTVAKLQAWLGDSTPTAAQTYMGQVRGTTEGGGSAVLAAFTRAVTEEHHE